MNPTMVGIVGLMVFVVLLFTGLPVGLSMMFMGTAGVVVLRGTRAAFQIVVGDILTQFSSYTICVVPLFSLMGYLASYSGVGEGLFRLAHKFIGHFDGGLALATQAACALFGAICGSMPATVATFGSIAYPEMKRFNYDDSLSTASIAAGSSLAVLIPPSMWFIIYGTATENSVGRLFLAGVPAGLLQMVLYMLTITFMVGRKPHLAPKSPKATWRDRFGTLLKGGLTEVIFVFLLSMGGLFAGWFTPTEAGAVGAGGMLFVTAIRRKINLKKLRSALKESVRLSAMIYLLLAGATIYGRFFALSGIPGRLGNFVTGMSIPPWSVLTVIILIYLVLGCFIDAMPMLLLTIPIFYPIICGTLGYDPIWYGVVIVVVIAMGSITPPVGVNVFILKGVIREVPLKTMFSGVWPFVIANVVMCLILIFIPQIVTFLPNLVYG
ncbi:MAG: TRAP transporter large permease [Oscillospiraceae bacterium]|nr:TRAP transporter large permease [Oscillospiraceae bacterium]